MPGCSAAMIARRLGSGYPALMETVLSIVMLAAIALVIGAYVLWRRGGSRKQIVLMLVLAAIMGGNVAIWTWPDAGGQSPLAKELK